jgi:AraC-like DNA-binding protein
VARPSLEPASPSPLVPALLRLLRARGADPSLLALRFGLDPGLEGRDEAPLTPSLLGDLLEASAHLLGEPFWALALPGELTFRRYGAGELSARSSATLRDALDRTARYLPLTLPGFEATFEPGGGEATFRLRARSPRAARRADRHVNEYGLAHVLSFARRETGLDLRPPRVSFAHARPRDLGPLRRFFGADDFAFGDAASGFVVPAGVLDAPTRAADARLLATAVDLAEAALVAGPAARTVAARAAERLRALLPETSLDAVAAALKMSPRTLQRRLGDEGTRYADVLDGVRREAARRLVDEPALPLADVAFRLGFADLASFHRAFKRWTGLPPGTFRRACGPAGTPPRRP